MLPSITGQFNVLTEIVYFYCISVTYTERDIIICLTAEKYFALGDNLL